MNDLPGRGDVNPYGIPVPSPHEQDAPNGFEGDLCITCAEEEPMPHRLRCARCERNLEEDRMNRETYGG